MQTDSPQSAGDSAATAAACGLSNTASATAAAGDISSTASATAAAGGRTAESVETKRLPQKGGRCAERQSDHRSILRRRGKRAGDRFFRVAGERGCDQCPDQRRPAARSHGGARGRPQARVPAFRGVFFPPGSDVLRGAVPHKSDGIRSRIRRARKNRPAARSFHAPRLPVHDAVGYTGEPGRAGAARHQQQLRIRDLGDGPQVHARVRDTVQRFCGHGPGRPGRVPPAVEGRLFREEAGRALRGDAGILPGGRPALSF